MPDRRDLISSALSGAAIAALIESAKADTIAGGGLSTASLPFVLATSYGVKANGVADDTAALQNAINAAKNATLILPAGTMIVSSSLNFGSASDSTYIVIGQSGGETGLTKFLWKGNSTTPMFSLNGIRDSKFSDFGILASSAFPLQTAFLSQTISGTIPTNNFYERVWVEGVNRAI